MKFLSRWIRRVDALLRSDNVERGMDDEMRLHLELEAQDLQLMGLSAEQAHQRAANTFGGVERFKEEAREARPLRLVENFTRDVQLAFRQLHRSRRLALSAATLLALGIGGTVAVFSVLNAIHFRPLPYADAERLVTVQIRTSDPRCGDRCSHDPTFEEALAFAANAPALEKFGTVRVTQGRVLQPSGARILKGAAVSESLSELLSMRVEIGRSLVSQDFRADAPAVMLLSHSAWLSEFGGDSAAIGRSYSLDDVTYVVAGVLKRSAELGSPLYAYNSPGTAQYFIADRGDLTRASSVARVIARLRSGQTVGQVTAQVDAQLSQRAASGLGQPLTSARANVEPLREVLANGYRASFWILFGAVAIVLLITCFNVTGLFLARLTDRANELATRTALGASRFRLAQQIGTETLVIAAAGGVGGIVLASFGTSAIRLLPTGQLPFWSDVSIDATAVLFAVLLTVGAGSILSIAPIFVLSPGRLLVSLRETVSASRSRTGLRSTLVALQVALSVVLLGSAGLLAKVLVDAELKDTGTAKHSMLYVFLQELDSMNDANVLGLNQRIADEIRRVPGVVSVAVEGYAGVPRPSGPRGAPRPPAMTVEGVAEPFPAAVAPSSATEVSPPYFETFGTRIIRGRAFTPDDRAGGTLVAIIDEPTERKLFGAASGLNRRVKFGAASSPNPWLTIVGISSRHLGNPLGTDNSYRPQLYRSILQFPAAPSTVLVRFSDDSYGQKEGVRRAIRNAEAALPITKMLTIEESIGSRLFAARFNTLVLAGFAVFAVLLSCLGIYAAVSISVASRQREIAIRMALGAVKREVTLLLLRSTTATVALGLLLGLGGAAFATKALRSMLYGTSATNPAIYAAVTLVMITTSLVAALVPARRASRTDPARMLRS